MKTVKYMILSLFTVVVLATATELFRAYCLADESYDHFYIRDISDEYSVPLTSSIYASRSPSVSYGVPYSRE